MFFKPLKSAYFLTSFPWYPFEKIQKTGDLGVLAELVITRRCGHFWSRGLAQNVVQRFSFMRILIIRSGHLRQGVFQAPKVGLFLSQFPLVPLLQNFQKRAI